MKNKTLLLLIILILCSFQACKNRDNLLLTTNTISKEHSISQRIDNYFKGMETLGFSGAIAVGYKDEMILNKGYGFADRENRIPFTYQTVQPNGSNTKQFTGAAILLLESRNLLSVNDSLTNYFENVPKDKQQITLHQLLTHSSGLLLGVGPDEDPIEFNLFFKKLMAEPLEFEPGSSYGYSNAGYSLLAKIIELISGADYETFIRENLLEPSGMTKTGYLKPKWDHENMAIGYRRGEKWGRVYKNGWIGDGPSWHLRGNGGLHTTAEDMYKWSATVKGNGVLNKNAVKKWTTGYVDENNGFSKYGYGLISYDDDKWGKIIAHSGSNGSFTSDFFWVPEKEFFFYIHSNNYTIPAYSFKEGILNVAFDKDFDFPPIFDFTNDIAPNVVKRKEGTYHHKEGTIKLTSDGIRLIGKISGQSVLDQMLKHDDEQREELARLTSKIEIVMNKLEQGNKNAFKDIVSDEEESKKVTHSFLNRIIQMRRKLESLSVIGSFVNTPGSQFYELGPYTTFVHARFENWNQYWNLVWKEDGTYKGNYSGPWPEFTLVPLDEKHFKGIRATQPWNTIDVEFQGDCLMLENELFCLSKNEE